jgi:hypothetical protein
MENVNFGYNYTDSSGAYFTWYHTGGSALTNVTWKNNVDTGTGNACD